MSNVRYEDYNYCAFIGRLFADPEFKEPGEYKVSTFSLAVNRRSTEEKPKEPNSIDFTCFGKTAELARDYLKKGMKILVTAHVDTNRYTTQDGSKRKVNRFIVDDFKFLEGKKNSSEDSPAAGASTDVDYDGFINVPDGIAEDLPFA